jgi:hypothetical protein
MLATVHVRVPHETGIGRVQDADPNYPTGSRECEEKLASQDGRNSPSNADSARSVARLKFAEAAEAG